MRQNVRQQKLAHTLRRQTLRNDVVYSPQFEQENWFFNVSSHLHDCSILFPKHEWTSNTTKKSLWVVSKAFRPSKGIKDVKRRLRGIFSAEEKLLMHHSTHGMTVAKLKDVAKMLPSSSISTRTRMLPGAHAALHESCKYLGPYNLLYLWL